MLEGQIDSLEDSIREPNAGSRDRGSSRRDFRLFSEGIITVGKPELGVKRRCLSCAAPFFDLNRTPIACPKCGALFQVVELAHSRPKWTPSPPVAIKTPVAAVDPFEAETAEAEVEDEDAQDEVEIPPIEEDEDIQLAEIIDIDRDAAKPDS
jgi:uncharacterized protein (TIGR02300 family)